jgi:hypothetical protein
MALYPLQVEKILDRYDALVAIWRSAVRGMMDRRRASSTSSSPRPAVRRARRARVPARRRTSSLVRGWGGVTLAYASEQDAPAYRLNHEEVRSRSGRHLRREH